MNKTVLLVEDDLTLANLISTFLKSKGFHCELTDNIEKAISKFEANNYDLIILDLRLKDEDGNSLIKFIRDYDGNHEKKRKSLVPILVLSGINKLETKKVSYGYGADEYVEKPMGLEELYLKVNSLIRRSMGHSGDLLKIGKLLVLDLNKKILKIKFFEDEDNIIDLTRSEYDLFKMLALNKGFTVNKKVIKKQLYFGRNFDINDNNNDLEGLSGEIELAFNNKEEDKDEVKEFKSKKAPLGLKVIDVMVCKIRKKIDDKIISFKDKIIALGENPNVTYIHTDWADGYSCFEKVQDNDYKRKEIEKKNQYN